MMQKLALLLLTLSLTNSVFSQNQIKRRNYCKSCTLPEKDATQAHMDSIFIQDFDKWRSLYLRKLERADQVYAVNQDKNVSPQKGDFCSNEMP